jgi:hypothetical protein
VKAVRACEHSWAFFGSLLAVRGLKRGLTAAASHVDAFHALADAA